MEVCTEVFMDVILEVGMEVLLHELGKRSVVTHRARST